MFPQVGARLLAFHRKWTCITQDQWVLETLREGLKLEFIIQPVLRLKETSVPRYGIHESVILTEINTLLGKSVIEPVPANQENAGFYSTIFVVPKKQGGLRTILNLKPLNQLIVPRHFKMETLCSIMKALKKGDFAISLDLTDAYFHIPIHTDFQKYLRFRFLGQSYQFRAMPFGLRSAPRVFTKILAVLAAHLRKMVIRVFMYLDDWLLVSANKTTLISQKNYVLQLVQELGLLVNWEKSSLVPSQHIEYLGAHFNLVEGNATPTETRFQSILDIVQSLFASQHIQAIVILKLLGLMASCIYLVPWGRLHMRPIQLYLLALWRPKIHPLTHMIVIRPILLQHLQWWMNRENFFKGMPLQDPPSQLTLITDASELGWGAHIENWETSGIWPHQYQQKHINWLELKAVQLALQEALYLIKGKVVLIRSDNTTVISYINKQGGTHSPELCYLTWELFQWCIQYKITIRAVHIPGKKNFLADALSRGKVVRMTEWSLNNTVVNLLFQQMGTPCIDLFATAENKKLPVYCSPFPDMNAFQVDALTISWKGMYAYAFPPPILVPKVLQKLREETSVVLLIAPMWPRQSWYPQILDLLIDIPVKLPLWPDLLSQNHNRVFHQNLETLNLVAWKLSNCGTSQKDFLKKLQKLWQMPERLLHRQFMMQDSEYITAGVKNRVSIPLQHLYQN